MVEQELRNMMEQERLLMRGLCPLCKIKLIRGKSLIERFLNRLNLRKYCPKCGFTVSGD